MQKISLPIDMKSLYLNIYNDNSNGHTPTVSTPIKQGNSINDKLEQIYKIPKQINFQNNHDLINELTKNSKSLIKINNVFVFNKFSVNGIEFNSDSSFCIYVKEEIDDTKAQYGRVKMHYPMSLKYSDCDLEIDNKKILSKISEILFHNAFIVNEFQYDFDNDNLNFKVTVIGENQIPYSKVFVNNKGAGNKFSNIFNEYADSYDMEIVALKKKYGDIVSAENFQMYYDEEKEFAFSLCEKYLGQNNVDIRNISKEFSYSLYDFDYEINGITKYMLVYFTSTNKKYFNISSKRLKFLNDMKNSTNIMLISDIESDPQISVYNVYDLNKFSSSINSIMMKEI